MSHSVSKQRRWQIANPHKHAAQLAVHRAITNGSLTRPDFCSRCSGPDPQAHHEDYSRQLDVVWLCAACHFALHKEMRAPAIAARRAAEVAARREQAEARAAATKAERSLADIDAWGEWNTPTYTDDELLAALRSKAVNGYISASRYRASKTAGDPSPSMFEIRFGSWNAAVEAAGLRHGHSARVYSRKSEADLARDVRRAVDASGGLPSIADYSRFRLEHPEYGMACSALVTRRLGLWADCLRLALEVTTPIEKEAA